MLVFKTTWALEPSPFQPFHRHTERKAYFCLFLSFCGFIGGIKKMNPKTHIYTLSVCVVFSMTAYMLIYIAVFLSHSSLISHMIIVPPRGVFTMIYWWMNTLKRQHISYYTMFPVSNHTPKCNIWIYVNANRIYGLQVIIECQYY